jgi:hypothetical protein
MSEPAYHRRTKPSPWPRRAPWIVLAVLVVAVLVATQIPQRADIVPLGETQQLSISTTKTETANVTVDLERDGDMYLIHFTADNPDARTDNHYWRLLDSTGTEHAAAADGCDEVDCVAVTVPTGTEITMVRWYGVDRPVSRYTGWFRTEWTGWTV